MSARIGVWLAASALAVVCGFLATAWAEDARTLMEPLPLSPSGQPVPGYPEGAPASPPDALKLTDADIAELKRGNYKAGIAMQALDSPWNTLQVQAITDTLAKYGVEVVALTDAAQDPIRQASHLENM